MSDDDTILMPDFGSVPEEDQPQVPESSFIEELSLEPEGLIAPVFMPTTYAEPVMPTPSYEGTPEVPESAEPKRRGRRPGSKNRPKSEVQLDNPNLPLTSALRRKTDQELSARAQGILIGTSKIPSFINPHIEMRPDEAQAIADPLVSYAKSHVDSEKIEQFVEQWDLIAVGIASAAYGMRVVQETRNDPTISSRRVPRASRPRVVQDSPANPQPEFRAEAEQSGTSDTRYSEDAAFNFAPSEPHIGDV